jgi:hypothetical protein
MIWGKRRFELADYAPYQVLAKLMLENPSLHSQFIMVSMVTDVPNVFNYYVGVPSQTFFADFDGFIIVDESDLRRPSRSYQCVWAYGSARLTLETRTPQGFWQDAPRHARRAGAFYSSCATTPGAGPRHHQCPRSGALAGRSMSDKSMTPSRTSCRRARRVPSSRAWTGWFRSRLGDRPRDSHAKRGSTPGSSPP